MKLHLAAAGDRNQFTGYGAGYVSVNARRYEHSIVVAPDALHEGWPVERIEALDSEATAFLLTLKPEVLLIGTGATQRFPGAAFLREFSRAQIGFEVMDTPAACRTFNILMAEGRNVIAAIIV